MKIDLYTKSVLTIIALSLVLLVAQNAVNSVRAATDITRVQICDGSNGRCAGVGTVVERNALFAMPPNLFNR
jgi:hypothetical protein